MSRDRIYTAPLQHVGDFEFDDQVADVFPDMIRRSVPGYASMLSMIGQATRLYATPETALYDLGCSLGAATMVMRMHAPHSCQIHAIDNSTAMIRRLSDRLISESGPGARVTVRQEDVRAVEVHNASLVVLNLTLQFLPPQDRTPVLQRVFDGMLPESALVLSEKVCFDDPDQQAVIMNLHHDFKRAHGYSDLEIAQKRTAIENRLIPETLECHVTRLSDVGFSTVAPWFQCFNFVSIIAIR